MIRRCLLHCMSPELALKSPSVVLSDSLLTEAVLKRASIAPHRRLLTPNRHALNRNPAAQQVPTAASCAILFKGRPTPAPSGIIIMMAPA